MVKSIEIDEIPIVWVGVYRHEAELRRSAVFTPTEGPGEYRVRVNLPDRAQGNWQTLRVEFTNDVVLQQLRQGETPISENALIENDPETKAINGQLTALLQKRAACEAVIASCKLEQSMAEEFVDSLLKPKYFPLEEALKGDDLLDVVQESNDLILKKIPEVKKELLEKSIELEEINQEILILLKKLNRITHFHINDDMTRKTALLLGDVTDVMRQVAPRKSKPWVDLHVEITKAEPTTVTLSYLTYCCNWNPDYDLRLESRDLSRVNLTYFGCIKQHSGESWENVHLTLHSGNPHNSGRPSELPVLKASEQLKEKATTGPQSGVFGTSVPIMLNCMAGPVCGAGFAPPPAGRLQSSFEMPGTVTIKDQEETRLEIFKGVLAVQTTLYCTPETSKDVFRGGLLINTTDFTLMAAHNVGVFWDGSFTSRTSIPDVVPGDTFEIFFGVDQRVRVDAQPVRKITKQTGSVLTGQGERITSKYNMIVTNSRKEPIVMVMPMRLPNSTDERLKVTLEGIKPKEVTLDRDINAGTNVNSDDIREPVTWLQNTTTSNCIALVKLGPVSNVKINYGYSIERPLNVEYEVV